MNSNDENTIVEEETTNTNTEEETTTTTNTEEETTNTGENPIITDSIEEPKPEPESESESESKNEKKTKSKKEQFSAECDHCSRIFKNKITYDKHVLQQLCYTQDEISYCKICCETLTNHNEYKKHLFTMKHLNNIGYNNIERLQNKEVSKIHLADPYLNKSDINKIANTNLGDSFTFVFTKGNTKTISLVNQESNQELNKESNINKARNNIQTLNNIQEINNSEEINKPQDQHNAQDHNISQEQNNSQYLNDNNIEYNTRQLKIISYLEKLSVEHTPGDSGKQFFKTLESKLQIEDYKGLQSIITNLNVLDNYKNTYIKVVDIFITMLVKEKNKGEKLYKNKDISQLVINLSS
jgi:hypothetical protein